MRKRLTYLITLILIVSLVSCVPYTAAYSPPIPSVVSPPGPRTFILEGDTVSADDMGGITCWYCSDYLEGGKTLVEVGYSNEVNTLGFILFDGTFSGELALYKRQGLEHRWNWGPNGNDYSFTINTDGKGSYFDFSIASDGEAIKPRAIYKCKQR